VILVVSIPMGYLNLDDNILVQILSFLGLMIICVIWVVYFANNTKLDQPVPPTASSAAAFGYVFFNYSFVITIPSWLSAKNISNTITHFSEMLEICFVKD